MYSFFYPSRQLHSQREGFLVLNHLPPNTHQPLPELAVAGNCGLAVGLGSSRLGKARGHGHVFPLRHIPLQGLDFYVRHVVGILAE
jgi:hypothetical protein